MASEYIPDYVMGDKNETEAEPSELFTYYVIQLGRTYPLYGNFPTSFDEMKSFLLLYRASPVGAENPGV